MQKILDFLRLTKSLIGLVIITIAVAVVFNFILDKIEYQPFSFQEKEDYRIPEKTYRESIITLPWQKDKAPLKEEKLPIPKKDVDKVIQIETQAPEGRTSVVTEIIIDKKGNIYKAKDTPTSTKIDVIKYEPKIIDFDLRFGTSLVLSDQPYFCLSLDYLRIWNFSLGSEVGIAMTNAGQGRYLVGLSLKYRLYSLGHDKNNGLRLSLVTGWNFMKDTAYGGINLKW